MWRRETVAMTWPQLKSRSKTQSERTEGSPLDYDQGLFMELKSWRSEEAESSRVPAFVIMHDATLKGIAAFHPQNLSELERVKGIGPSKVAKYGNALIEIVDGWIRKQESAKLGLSSDH